MTGPEAYRKAVEYANKAAEYTDINPGTAANYATVATAFAAIAQAEATARGTANPGCLPGGGWHHITDPNN